MSTKKAYRLIPVIFRNIFPYLVFKIHKCFLLKAIKHIQYSINKEHYKFMYSTKVTCVRNTVFYCFVVYELLIY